MTVDDIKTELADADRSGRLDDWERRFVENLSSRPPYTVLTEAQQATWLKIEEKIYGAG